MRSRRGLLPHLPWALALFVPLLLVAVLGAVELSRQSARVADAVQQQATTFLTSARLHFEGRLRVEVDAALQGVRLTTHDLVAATVAAVEHDQRVVDLFCLDAQGGLVHPRLAMARESALPFLAPTTSDEVRIAEALAALSEREALERGCALLRRYLQRRQAPAAERARAAFRLGSLLRRLGDVDAAESAYLDARLAAADSDASPIGIELLTRVAIAEMRKRPDDLLDLARGISENEWFAVPDDLLGSVFARVLAELPPDATDEALLKRLRTHESARRLGRRQAAEFNRFAAAPLERLLGEASAEPVLRSIGSGADCALLALRRTTPEEQAAAGRRVRWLGLRIDLPGLVNEVMDAFLSPNRAGHRLVVLDPDGQPLLETANPTARPMGNALDVPSLAGLVLRAVPDDPEATLHDQQAAVRNRVLLLAALLALALGGGFLLVRSVARETEVSDLKVVFVSRMSHELKTPLALIKMYGETLALGRAQDDAQVRSFGGIVAREADRLNDQIERILTFARQLSGTLRYAPEKVDLCAQVEDVVEEYRDHVRRSGCSLSARIDPGARGAVAAVDPHALHLALSSLIDNAVKYTPKDRPEREVALELERHGGSAVLAVRDHGIGIPEAERRRVFEPFYRASNAGEVRGAGLGLGQVRHFAEAHRGDVAVLASPEGGTVVRIRLPLANNDPETRAQETTAT